jgi:hypothetical protein
MREEILPDALRARFEDSGADITGASQVALAREWNPLMYDPSEGFGVTLKTTDPLALEVMKDFGLLARSRAIAREELMRATFDSVETPAFVRSVLEDLIAPEGDERVLYEEERW